MSFPNLVFYVVTCVGFFRVNTLASGYFVYEDEEVIKQKIIVSDMKPVQAVKYNVVVDQLGVNIPNPRTSKIIETVSFAVKR